VQIAQEGRVRRLVTGHDHNGLSVVVSDENLEGTNVNGLGLLCRLWSDDSPAIFPSPGVDPESLGVVPPPGGVRMILFTLPPRNNEVSDGETALPGAVERNSPAGTYKGVHCTDTTDFIFVASGTLELELDNRITKTVNAGDTIVMNGTNHCWHNLSEKPATIVVCFVGANRT